MAIGESPDNPFQFVLNLIAIVNQILKKVIEAKNLKDLTFIILNDSILVMPYDKASLWQMSKGRIKLLGVSGQATYTTSSEAVNNWKVLLSSLSDVKRTQNLTQMDFQDHLDAWKFVQKTPEHALTWVPLAHENDEVTGLILERWDAPVGQPLPPDNLKVFEEYLVPGYASAWRQHQKLAGFKRFRELFHSKMIGLLILALLLLSFFIRVPMRVVAPCEIVPKDPYVITAPLDGIIAKIDVTPGEDVKKGTMLYHYDPRIPLQELKIAQNQVQIIRSEMNRVIAIGVENETSLLELAILKLKLQKAELDFVYSESRAKQIFGYSPVEGVAVINNPDQWRGKPVKIGEKIMVISNPQDSKIKIWIPENDNIKVNFKEPIVVFLNPDPATSYSAKLDYIAEEATLSVMRVPSFVAEAEWTEPPKDVKLGVQGSAIIYGERVSLFYYIFRRPIDSLRVFFQV